MTSVSIKSNADLGSQRGLEVTAAFDGMEIDL